MPVRVTSNNYHHFDFQPNLNSLYSKFIVTFLLTLYAAMKMTPFPENPSVIKLSCLIDHKQNF